MATQRAPRGNKYAGNCDICGNVVPAGTGLLIGSRQKGWGVRHRPATMVGFLDTARWVGGCPDDGAPLPEREPRWNRRGAGWSTDGQVWRGRCEDAPCCGCCS